MENYIVAYEWHTCTTPSSQEILWFGTVPKDNLTDVLLLR